MKFSEVVGVHVCRPATIVVLLMIITSCRVADFKGCLKAGFLSDSPGEELVFSSNEAVSSIHLIPRRIDDPDKYLTLDLSVVDPNSQAPLGHRTIRFTSADCEVRSSRFKVPEYLAKCPFYNENRDQLEYRLKIISSSKSHKGFDVHYSFIKR